MSKHSELYNFLINKDKPSERVFFHPILMQFAARLLNCTYEEFMRDYRVLVESNVKCLEVFDLDAVGLISDPYRETSAFGGTVEFNGNHPPVCAPLIHSLNEIESLVNPGVYHSERTRDRLKAAEYYKKLLGDDIPIIGWIEGPLAEAADLIGVNNLLTKLLMEPDFIQKLMNICMTTAKDFARAQVEAGCLVIGIGDAVCSQIDPDTYESMVLPLHQDLMEHIHSLGAFAKLHICGDITHLLDKIALTNTDILDLDWMVTFESAREACGPGTILCGNLDPVQCIQNKSSEVVLSDSIKLIEQLNGQRFILSGGCEITVATPVDNLLAMKKSCDA
ncbi:MAG: uroporphyrinogen decarboxylase family protein [Bacteroidales bacterium]|nr:uroporphyrinogen decarboxylase family protein [Bacteroidales bacterium]